MKLKLKELKKFFVRRIAAVSDLHLMSRYSLFPPEFETSEGNIYKANAGQKSLWESYKTFCNVCDEWEVDTVLLASDLIHGQNPIERGIGLISTNLNEQLDLAELTLTPLLKGRESHWVSGSPYHNSAKGMATENELFNRLVKSKVTSGTWSGQIANLKVKPFNKIINMTHGGGAAAYYRETIAAREMVYGKAAVVNEKLPKFDMYIHGHFHWFNYMHQEKVHHLQLPGWTAYEPVAIFTKNYTRMQPDIGGALILFDESGRITVWHYSYPLPHIADKVVEI
jgi:hypothetical protein